jgi:acyl carrier protein
MSGVEAVAMETANIVLDVLKETAVRVGYAPDKLRMETSLVHDMGLDSVDFMGLTVDLEDALALDSFPMEAWVERQKATREPPFAVRDLVEFCTALHAQQRGRP